MTTMAAPPLHRLPSNILSPVFHMMVLPHHLVLLLLLLAAHLCTHHLHLMLRVLRVCLVIAVVRIRTTVVVWIDIVNSNRAIVRVRRVMCIVRVMGG
jgi:hypothetical protein